MPLGATRPERVDVHWVPGSFELPLAAMTLARTRRYAAVVCVGVVIRGETPHYEYVAGAAAQGLSRVASGIRREKSIQFLLSRATITG